MTTCNCLVQEGQIAPETERTLRTQLTDFAKRAFDTELQISWVVIPEHNGFTAGEPTRASVVSMRATAPLEQSRRVELLQELCDLWTHETRCSHDELVGVISDPQSI
ncbi:MAG: hypothetical protein AAGG11_12845 [Pseudomonadota bacterium]